MITEQGVLISHTEVNWRMLDHAGESYKVYGLSAVFTYPAFRWEGFGRQVVEAATGFIDKSDADFAMLFCARDMESFYGRAGWEAVPGLRVSSGPEDAAIVDDGNFMMLRFISEHGIKARDTLKSSTLYVGSYLW